MVDIMWYLSGFQLSHYTEGFCSASPLEEILAYTFSRYPIKSTTAHFNHKKEVCFYFIFYLLYFGIWCHISLWWIDMKTIFQELLHFCVNLCLCQYHWERDTWPAVCLWQWNWVCRLRSWNNSQLKFADCQIIPNSCNGLFL